MLGDPDSPFDNLWSKFTERFDFLVPLWIVRRPESLAIFDYRPTFMMFAVIVLLIISLIGLGLFAINFDPALWLIGGVAGLAAAVAVFLLFRFTIREVYYFDAAKDKYIFTRQFIHRSEVIEGSLSQFSGATVKTERNEDSETHFVVLKQEGMFLTGVGEQILREEIPIFNSSSREARIAGAISGILALKQHTDRQL
jgi:hypothetical protein